MVAPTSGLCHFVTRTHGPRAERDNTAVVAQKRAPSAFTAVACATAADPLHRPPADAPSAPQLSLHQSRTDEEPRRPTHRCATKCRQAHTLQSRILPQLNLHDRQDELGHYPVRNAAAVCHKCRRPEGTLLPWLPRNGPGSWPNASRVEQDTSRARRIFACCGLCHCGRVPPSGHAHTDGQKKGAILPWVPRNEHWW